MFAINPYAPCGVNSPDVILAPLDGAVTSGITDIGRRLEEAGISVQMDHRRMPIAEKFPQYWAEDNVEFVLLGTNQSLVEEGTIRIRQRDRVWGKDYGYPVEDVIQTILEHYADRQGNDESELV